MNICDVCNQKKNRFKQMFWIKRIDLFRSSLCSELSVCKLLLHGATDLSYINKQICHSYVPVYITLLLFERKKNYLQLREIFDKTSLYNHPKNPESNHPLFILGVFFFLYFSNSPNSVVSTYFSPVQSS